MNTLNYELIKQLYSHKFTNSNQNQSNHTPFIFSKYNNLNTKNKYCYQYHKKQNPIQRVIKIQNIIKRQTSLPNHSIVPHSSRNSTYNPISFYIHTQNNQQQSPKQKQIPTFYYVHQIKNNPSLFNTINIKKNHTNSPRINIKNKNHQNKPQNNASTQKNNKIFHIMEIFKQKPNKGQIYTPGRTMPYSKKSFQVKNQSNSLYKANQTIQGCFYSSRRDSKQMKNQNNQNKFKIQIRKKVQSQKEQRVKKFSIEQKYKNNERKNILFSIRNKINKKQNINDDQNDLNPWVVVDNQF